MVIFGYIQQELNNHEAISSHKDVMTNNLTKDL
jgi:hypothetical protein